MSAHSTNLFKDPQSGLVRAGACCASRDPEVQLITHALGSCIAVTLYDAITGVGGLLQFMLPEAALDPDRAAFNPFLSADTAFPLLLQKVCGLGALQSRLHACLAGGTQTLSEGSFFNMGKKNYLAARKLLWKAGIDVKREAVGGHISRTMALDIGTGIVRLRTPGKADQTIFDPNAEIAK